MKYYKIWCNVVREMRTNIRLFIHVLVVSAMLASPAFAFSGSEARIMMITDIAKWLKQPLIMDTLDEIYKDQHIQRLQDLKSIEEAWRYNSKNFRDITLESPISKILQGVVEEKKDKYIGIILLDKNGFVVGSSFDLAEYIHRDKDYFINTYNKGAGILHLKEEEDGSVITMAHTIDRNGIAQGVLVVLLNPEYYK